MSLPLLVRGLSEGRDFIILALTAHHDTRRLGVPRKAQIHAEKSDEIEALSENVRDSAKPGKEGSASQSPPRLSSTGLPKRRQGGSGRGPAQLGRASLNLKLPPEHSLGTPHVPTRQPQQPGKREACPVSHGGGNPP